MEICAYGLDGGKCETYGIKCKDLCCLEYRNIKDDLIENQCLCTLGFYKKIFDNNLRNLLTHVDFLTIISINLLSYREKVFPHISI